MLSCLLFYPREILLNAGENFTRLVRAELPDKPLFWLPVTLLLIAAALIALLRVAERDYVVGGVRSASRQRHPMILGDSVPQPRWASASGTAAAEIVKGALPVSKRESGGESALAGAADMRVGTALLLILQKINASRLSMLRMIAAVVSAPGVSMFRMIATSILTTRRLMFRAASAAPLVFFFLILSVIAAITFAYNAPIAFAVLMVAFAAHINVALIVPTITLATTFLAIVHQAIAASFIAAEIFWRRQLQIATLGATFEETRKVEHSAPRNAVSHVERRQVGTSAHFSVIGLDAMPNYTTKGGFLD